MKNLQTFKLKVILIMMDHKNIAYFDHYFHYSNFRGTIDEIFEWKP